MMQPNQPVNNPPQFRLVLKPDELAREIFENQTRLVIFLDRLEQVIRQRWLKKTPKKKRWALINAWPNMPTYHAPDFQHMLQKNCPALDAHLNGRMTILRT